ncbi:MAG TPA: hypothetical protein VK667_00275, partial [Ktedonobacteraceae bacterium]|nr:hypothetical protein [Ktedonobacteraceae bacterium]
MAGENRRNDDQEIVPGMKVEATEGDLGEQDVSPAKVTDVEMNQQGDVEAIKVSKGVLFKKELEVPADRIQAVNSVDADDKSNGTIMIDAKEEELESLTKPGQQTLPPESERPQDDPLDVLEQQVPTTEGM